jgi:hypothetical protein
LDLEFLREHKRQVLPPHWRRGDVCADVAGDAP